MRGSKSRKRESLPGKVVQLVATTTTTEIMEEEFQTSPKKLVLASPPKKVGSKADFPPVPPQSYAQACQHNHNGADFAMGHTRNEGFQRQECPATFKFNATTTPTPTPTPPVETPTVEGMDSWLGYFWSFVPFS